MKRYTSVYQMLIELLNEGYSDDCKQTIYADSDPEATSLSDAAGNMLMWYPGFKYYHLSPNYNH